MGGGGSQKNYESNKQDPWAPQQPYLQDAFKNANIVYNQRANGPAYTGDFEASYQPGQVDKLKSIQDWANSNGQGMITAQGAGGQGLFEQGAAGLGEVNSGLRDFAAKDWTQQHITDANRYADNPFLSEMVQASTRDAQRTFNEDTIRGINQNAAATGNTNSTRAGVAAGIAQRGIADFVGDTSAKMRGDAWNTGLQMSQGDQSSLLQSLLGRGELAGNMVGQGNSAINDSLSNEAGLLGLNSSIAELLKANDQSSINNQMQKYDYADTRAQNLLSDYYNIVGDKLWGSEGTTIGKKKDQPSAMSTAGSIVGMLGSLFKSDKRTKDIISQVGYTTDGLPLYRYTYKDAKHLGEFVAPLAQDVQDKFPEAVVEVNGVLYIDTNKYDWR